MYAADAPHAPELPAAQRRHNSRVLGALIALGSTPALRCWSGHWWPPSMSSGEQIHSHSRLAERVPTWRN